MKTFPIDKLLVLMDFSPQAEAAYKYALNISQQSEAKILLVNFVKNAGEVKEAEDKMQGFLNKFSKAKQDRTTAFVEVAGLENGVEQVAERFNTKAIILGKHDNTIFENIFGSKAIDLVESVHYPFIIVQHEIPEKPIENILLAFNHERESLQATQMVASMAKLYNATVHLVPYDEYEDDLKRDVKLNEKLIVDYLMEHNINFELAEIPRGSLYKSMLISYAHSNNIDLISAAYLDFGPSSFFQSFIDDLLMYDPEIPVLTVNGPEVMIHKPKLNFVPA